METMQSDKKIAGARCGSCFGTASAARCCATMCRQSWCAKPSKASDDTDDYANIDPPATAEARFAYLADHLLLGLSA